MDSAIDTAAAAEQRICPVCNTANAPEAIFCGNHACHKALGEFAYVAEAFAADSRWIEKLADRVAGWVGHPHFLTLHLAWFALWVGLNSAAVAGGAWEFDAYPYGLLGIVLAIEAALITSMLLISGHRQARFEARRAEFEYEANISSYRLLQKLAREIQELQEQVGRDRGNATDTPH